MKLNTCKIQRPLHRGFFYRKPLYLSFKNIMDTTSFTIPNMNIEQFFQYIDWVYLVIFMSMAYTFKNLLTSIFTMLLQYKWPTAQADKKFSIFVIGVVIALPFYYLFDSKLLALIFSATVGTSLHDWFIQYIIKLYNSKFGK